MLERVDLDAGRVRAGPSIDASASLGLWQVGGRATRLQLDAYNLANRLNVITFAGPLSGTALGPGRSATVRIRAEF